MAFARSILRHFGISFQTSESFVYGSFLPFRSFSKNSKKTNKPGSHHEILATLGEELSLDEAESKMQKSVEHLKTELANIRSGRATSGMLDHMTIESSSGLVSLKTLGTVTVRDSTTLGIALFDAASSSAVLEAIQASPLQLQSKVMNEHELLVTFPKPTQETLDTLAKLIGKEGEHSKTAIRSARKLGMAEAKKLSSKDDQRRAEKAVETLTESYVRQIDELCLHKKQELHNE